jgi:Spy/CpxP family protein refolding chaperone
MNKTLAFALLTLLVSAPALADDSTAKVITKNAAPAASPAHKHEHKMAAVDDECATMHGKGNSDECDTKHGKGAHDECDTKHGMKGHTDHDMMGNQHAGMMREPDMHLLASLGLSDDQRSKINKLSDELRHSNWTAKGLINDESAKLRDLYEADQRDPAMIGKEYQVIFDLERQMIETYLTTQNRIEEILTVEQRAKLKAARHSARPMGMHFKH